MTSAPTPLLPGFVLRLALLAALCASGSAGAETVGTFKDRHGTIRLTSQACAGGTSGQKRAVATSSRGTRSGCWAVGEDGNPVVHWHDGQRQQLDGNLVRLSPKYAALLEDEPGAGGGNGFPRPAWCPRARFPHEKAVCRDPELAAQDLQLAPLWREFKARRQLTATQTAWHKSDFFHRLKTCGADKACISREQQAQRALYENALR